MVIRLGLGVIRKERLQAHETMTNLASTIFRAGKLTKPTQQLLLGILNFGHCDLIVFMFCSLTHDSRHLKSSFFLRTCCQKKGR